MHKKRLSQFVNYLEGRFDFSNRRPLKWVYIHGMHRSGTSYVTRKVMEKARRGCGDFMLGQFAQPMLAVRERAENRAMNSQRLWNDFRQNLLRSAHIGSGRDLDAVVKQATGSALEVEFLTELFCAPPELILFLFREPHGWLQSVIKKFPGNDDQNNVTAYYKDAFERHSLIGGLPIVYNETLPSRLKSIELFADVDFSDFSPTKTRKVPEAQHLEVIFEKKCLELL